MDLEELKKQKMQELQQEMLQSQVKEQLQLQQQLEQLEAAAKAHMTREAIARYGTLKAAHRDKAIHSLLAIVQLAQNGKLQAPVTDAQYKMLLQGMIEEQKETVIRRK